MTRMTRHQSSSRGLRRRLAISASILACLAAAALVAASAPAQSTITTDTHATGLQQDLDALVAAGAPGAILLVRNGTHTVQLTAGMRDIAHKTPIAAGDHFKIASLTKTYTATVVLQLAGEGKLSLDDSVQRRLPGVVPNGSKITIRQLLNHTSGLADFETDRRYLKPYLSRKLRLLLVASPACADWRLAQAAVCTRSRLVVLQHKLRRRSADRGEGDRQDPRCRAETQDLPATPP